MVPAVAEAVFVVTGVAHLCAVLLLVWDVRRRRAARLDAFGSSAALRPAGVLVWSTFLVTTVAGLLVAGAHIVTMPLSTPTAELLTCGLVMTAVRTPPALVTLYVTWEVVLRRTWRQRPASGTGTPMVTVQVPTYAEPPEIVIGTLDALARLDYPSFEVLVIDNNTADERLWRPVQEHCARLGSRFRFLHVEGITGAKAGALNWARPYVDPRTELIALVDADYQVDPRWLADTVGFFEDPGLGFVQCPHAYRDYEQSAYGRMVTARYDRHVPEHVSNSEHDTNITIGTMSLIRLSAIDKAGGWAEWCQTEDSEFAIRVHAVGYSSLFLDRPYGWGLIPESLVELKKQRFRWTYGPGTELKAHARLYLPGRLGQPSLLNRRQRIRHAAYGLNILVTGLAVLGLPIGAALLVSMFAHGEAPVVSPRLLLPVAATLLGQRVMRWLSLRESINVTWAQFFGGGVALLAVRPTVSIAAFSALVGRPVNWWRTSKFRTAPSVLRGLAAAAPELALAIGWLAATIATPIVLPSGAGTWLLTLGFGWQALTYATAPLLAVLAERAQRASVLPDAPGVATENRC